MASSNHWDDLPKPFGSKPEKAVLAGYEYERAIQHESEEMICYFSGPSRVLELFVPGGAGHGSAALSFSQLSGDKTRSPKAEARNAELLVCRFVLRISGFGLLLAALSRRRSGSDLGHRLCRVLAETEFIGVSTFGFMLPQRLAGLFSGPAGHGRSGKLGSARPGFPVQRGCIILNRGN
jgi:hypothetical protein